MLRKRSHDVVQAISCSLLQSPAVLGHLEGPVMSGIFLNMSKILAEGEICQNSRMHDAYSLANNRPSFGGGGGWSGVISCDFLSSYVIPHAVSDSPQLSPTVLVRPRQSQSHLPSSLPPPKSLIQSILAYLSGHTTAGMLWV